MNLFEINSAIEGCIDAETGEIIDIEMLDNLEMDKTSKIENLGCWYKNLIAEAEALKTEKNAFAEREKKAKNKAESIKRYLSAALNGEKFKTPKCAMSFRRTESVEILDPEALEDDATAHSLGIVQYEPKFNKTEIKKAIKEGTYIRGCVLSENYSISIK